MMISSSSSSGVTGVAGGIWAAEGEGNPVPSTGVSGEAELGVSGGVGLGGGDGLCIKVICAFGVDLTRSKTRGPEVESGSEPRDLDVWMRAGGALACLGTDPFADFVRSIWRSFLAEFFDIVRNASGMLASNCFVSSVMSLLEGSPS
jgi:hypothetical protein